MSELDELRNEVDAAKITATLDRSLNAEACAALESSK